MNESSHKYLFLLFILFLITGCTRESGKFIKVDPGTSNVHFSNNILESDSVNVFDFPNVYNGGGVGIGDFNNDSLPDIYFTGNMVSNKLYLNKGNFTFTDVTETAGVTGNGRWSRGVAVVDINNDGLQDIYVCATAKSAPGQRVNMLYVNQGLNEDKVPVFIDMASAYGLADTTQSTMAYFFDYDNDGDLDVYIGVNHIIQDEYANIFRTRNLNGEHPSTGKLYQNNWSDSLQHGVYTDVSRAAGILIEGYTHAANIFDVNNDGWQDILVTNDYVSNNVLYINNRDGTFTDRVTEYFKHTAVNSMGSDAADFNNDGLEDVIEVDMAPQDNLRKKMFLSPINYQAFLNSEQYGYQYQYTRNILQVNLGPTIGEADSIQHPVFADLGFFAGIAETDWSWTPLVADYDSDGFKDILFTNGFPKDITDRDFMTFRNKAYSLTSKKEMLGEIPEVKIHNYIYSNNGGLKFIDKTFEWGMEAPNFSNGAAYADLDGDGDLDLVINTINDSSVIYENRLVEPKQLNYLSIEFKGTPQNIQGIGAKVIVHHKDSLQLLVNNPYRGYLSSVSNRMYVGLGNNTTIDSVVIHWPGNLKQVIAKVASNQLLRVDVANAIPFQAPVSPILATDNLFTNITATTGIAYTHQQTDFVDFNIQKLLPHKFSEYAPGIATGDINGDGLDDFITAGAPGYSAQVFRQDAAGKFRQSSLLEEKQASAKTEDDRGLLLFDADNDGDLDLYISSGGTSYLPGDSAYQDRYYTNNGKGEFSLADDAIPQNTGSTFCVRAADYDRDGDLDLFVAGRLSPQNYPKPVSSYIYRNDSKNGIAEFTDVTATVAPSLVNMGLACDAIFSDYDNDGWVDLVIAGEWMPLTFLRNVQGKFINETPNTGLAEYTGWWNSIAAGDFDNDGDIDYVAGNVGLNSFYRASPGKPVGVYAKDFDDNGSFDALPSVYLKATAEKDAPWQEFPAHGRDDMVKQMIGTRRTFQNYIKYARAGMEEVLPAKDRENALVYKATHLASSYLENKGGGKFSLTPLPDQAQFSVLNGMLPGDFDGDGNLDLVINTNDYGTDPSMGRYDGLNGLVLKGNGNGRFTPLSILQSGINITGDGKALATLQTKGQQYLLVATQNKGKIQVYRPKKPGTVVTFKPGDLYAMVRLSNGKQRKVENYRGSSFLSQSGQFFSPGAGAIEITIMNTNGTARKVAISK